MINGDVIAGMAQMDVRSLSAHFVFADSNSGIQFFEGFSRLSERSRRQNTVKMQENLHKSKEGVVIGNDVWIGHGAQIMAGVNIGDGAVIGAGSIVTRDVPPYTVVGGAPARVLRQRFTDNQIKELLRLRWWRYDPGIFEGLDITDISGTIEGLKKRVLEGYPEYTCEKFVFFDKEKKYVRLGVDGHVVKEYKRRD